MNAQCSKCGKQLSLPWIFCPHCGFEVTPETHPEVVHAEPQKSSVPGAFGGLLFGVIAVPILIIVGTLLCLTGLGAFLGIPMILAAIIAPLAGPLLGIGEHKGKCPSCGTSVISVTDGQVHYCPTCAREFALGDHLAAKMS
jgi:DNA-directed RNA polymerase subunit RPC12/RpoP